MQYAIYPAAAVTLGLYFNEENNYDFFGQTIIKVLLLVSYKIKTIDYSS